MSKRKGLLVAMLMVMGFWGYVHLVGGIIRAIHYHQLSQANAYNLVRINGLLGHAGQTWWGFTLGWLVFIAGIGAVYSYIIRPRH